MVVITTVVDAPIASEPEAPYEHSETVKGLVSAILQLSPEQASALGALFGVKNT